MPPLGNGGCSETFWRDCDTAYQVRKMLGMRASLGTDWLTFYYDISHQVDPLWDNGEYNRRYMGLWSVFGTRLDIGNLIIKMLK